MGNLIVEEDCAQFAHKPLRAWRRLPTRPGEWSTDRESRIPDPRLWLKGRQRHIVPAELGTDPGTRELFYSLRDRWESETLELSNISRIILNEAYQRIIGMGQRVVPLIIADLREYARLWFPALRAILGVDPVDEKDRGDMEAMRKAWLDWAAENGYS